MSNLQFSLLTPNEDAPYAAPPLSTNGAVSTEEEFGTAVALFGNDNSGTRTLDDILNERHEDLNYTPSTIPDTKNFYRQQFNIIQQNIFDKEFTKFEITPGDREAVNKEFNIDELNETIGEFKEKIVISYEELREKETKYLIAKNKYDKFADVFATLTQEIAESSITDSKITEDDKTLSDLIYSKIKDSYTNLRVEELQKEYSNSSIKFSMLRETIANINCLDQKHGCTLCWENVVELIFYPCGHTTCKKCWDKGGGLSAALENPQLICHMCREVIVDVKPIYFN